MPPLRIIWSAVLSAHFIHAFVLPTHSFLPYVVTTKNGATTKLLATSLDNFIGEITEGIDKITEGIDESFRKRKLTGLKANSFQHPFDQDATRVLKRLPGLESSVRAFVPFVEEGIYLDNIANSILVGPRQLSSIYNLLIEACLILDMEPPELYVRQNPVPNAYTLAVKGKKPFVVLHTSLIDLMSPAEVQAVIAHELGHLKCEHGVWITAANILANGIYKSGFGLGGLIADALGFKRLLQRWRITAELTCDRAALLVAQDVQVVASVLLKLVGGGIKNSNELSSSEFLKQANLYDDAINKRVGRFITRIVYSNLTHPLPVLRARELDIWSKSFQYKNLLEDAGTLIIDK